MLIIDEKYLLFKWTTAMRVFALVVLHNPEMQTSGNLKSGDSFSFLALPPPPPQDIWNHIYIIMYLSIMYSVEQFKDSKRDKPVGYSISDVQVHGVAL